MELLQVLKRGLQQVSGHGGLRGYLRVFFRANDVRVGTLVGEDKYGNKYYEDNKQFFGRQRWVIYTTEMNGKNTYWNVDGSMVPPEWPWRKWKELIAAWGCTVWLHLAPQKAWRSKQRQAMSLSVPKRKSRQSGGAPSPGKAHFFNLISFCCREAGCCPQSF
ncbi:NADH dehydrogenase [ubiquinone] 1 alpha subcomplex subunit 12 isoform X1 [Manis pentadactyla]|uniref:NADH dehydrogenase [ubiquinone] 1 alpha subcomplex subunit 12 isoform X1 n=1 Tax=Manis pentadactyla TaxID=143292 RepID=UPI00255C531A|nr:NADH dehydrogenase [ubiquinone] 1 alpha subcomplex subunit 12 isoform X1 [Manis pentadactyla]